MNRSALKTPLLLGSVLLLFQYGSAQNGKWIRGMAGSTRPVTAAELSLEKKYVDRIHRMVQSAYTPVGVDATYTGVYGYQTGEDEKWFANPFFYNVYLVRPGAGESGTSMSIVANSMEWIVPLKGVSSTSAPSFFYIGSKPEETNGTLRFTVKKDFTTGTSLLTGYLVTYPGKLPYLPVSRKEYLLQKKKVLDKKKQEEAARLNVNVLFPIRPEQEQEQAKQKTIADIKAGKWGGSTEARLKRFLDEYKTDEQLREEGINKLTGYYTTSLDKINQQLTSSSENELNQQAVVAGNYLNEFAGFVPASDRDAHWVIKLNPDYFNYKLPRSVPQFVTVFFKNEEFKNPVYLSAIQDIRKAVDFNTLQSMLGKDPGTNTISISPKKSPAPEASIQKQENTLLSNAVFENKPTPGFQQTPLPQIKNSKQVPVVNTGVKSAAISLQLDATGLQKYLDKILHSIDQLLSTGQKKAMDELVKKIPSPGDLADAGIMLYYKKAPSEAIWCLAKAASINKNNDNTLNNLAAVLNLSNNEGAALPILRYLEKKYPRNSTVLNNLGQAWWGLGEINNSKKALDSCIRVFALHPQANLTRCLIAESEGKEKEALDFLQKSIKGGYTEDGEQLAGKKNIKLDYSLFLNRHHPVPADYFNARKYLPPDQCKNVLESGERYTEWKNWDEEVNKVLNKVSALAEASLADYSKSRENIPTVLSGPPMNRKATHLVYDVYLPEFARAMDEAVQYYNGRYTEDKTAAEKKRDDKLAAVREKYQGRLGEGKENPLKEACREREDVNNNYLLEMATLNDNFNQRFGNKIRQLGTELMYWTLLRPGNRDMLAAEYYKYAGHAILPLIASSAYASPCEDNQKNIIPQKNLEAPDLFCPVSVRFKIAVAKISLGCDKAELEIETEPFVFNIERNFISKTSTLAFGVGASVELTDKNSILELVDDLGGGIGAKAQAYVEIGKNGVTDVGMRGEAGIEMPILPQGDLKVSGKLSVVSGPGIEATEGVTVIGTNLSNLVFTK